MKSVALRITFLKLYEDILVKDGEIHFKTDNQGLFEYSLKSFSWYGLHLNFLSLDLHNSGIEGNIMTEYEENSLQKGKGSTGWKLNSNTHDQKAAVCRLPASAVFFSCLRDSLGLLMLH